MISVQQIRAARALISWSQKQLGEIAGISQAGIANIESGKTRPTTQTMTAIRSALENAGVEFIDRGVRYKPDEIEIIQGEDFTTRMMNYVYETLLHYDQKEYLLSGVDFSMLDTEQKSHVQAQVDRLVNFDMRARVLVEEGTEADDIVGPKEWYRSIPREVFYAATPCFVFYDRFALMMFEKQKVVIIRNADVAEDQRRKFQFLWENADGFE